MRCRHCGVEIRRSGPNNGGQQMYADSGHWWTCEGVPQGMGGTNHQPARGPVYNRDAEIPIADPAYDRDYRPPIPSVNEGRLNVNVGRYCQRCSTVIQQGERSHRVWGDEGQSIYTYHLNPVCHRKRDSRGRFLPERQPTRPYVNHTSNMTWTTSVGRAYANVGTAASSATHSFRTVTEELNAWEQELLDAMPPESS